MKVRLILDGSSETIGEILSLCLAEGVITTMQVDDQTQGLPHLPEPPKRTAKRKTKAEYLKPFVYGTRVEVIRERTDRPEVPPLGSQGKVENARASGVGAMITVDFDGSSELVDVPSSMLQPIQG